MPRLVRPVFHPVLIPQNHLKGLAFVLVFLVITFGNGSNLAFSLFLFLILLGYVTVLYRSKSHTVYEIDEEGVTLIRNYPTGFRKRVLFRHVREVVLERFGHHQMCRVGSVGLITQSAREYSSSWHSDRPFPGLLIEDIAEYQSVYTFLQDKVREARRPS